MTMLEGAMRGRAAAALRTVLMRAIAVGSLWIAFIAPALGQQERVTVRLDGRPLFRVGATGDDDPMQRARRIERRLATLLEQPAAIGPASVEAPADGGQDRTVAVSGVPIVTVTAADAQDNLLSIDALAQRWAQVLDAELSRARASRVSGWSRLVAETRGSIDAAFARVLESATAIVPRTLAALVVVGFFWLLAAIVRHVVRALVARFIVDRTVENLIKQVSYYTVWALGLIVAADALGFTPQSVVTGLGLTSLALGFALKDVLSNFVSGILLLTLRPFQIGDQIAIDDTEGSVERIDLRATQIRTYDGRVVLVPNADLLTSRVVNNTAAPVRRGSVTVHLDYATDLRAAMSAALDAVRRADGVLEAPAPSLQLREFGPEKLVLEVRFWADSRRSDFLTAATAVRLGLVDSLRAAGVALPEPTLKVELDSPPRQS